MEYLLLLKAIFMFFKSILRYVIAFYMLIIWGAIGVLSIITGVGLPFFKKIFKISILMFASPYDIIKSKITLDYSSAPVKNVIWCCTFGAIGVVLHVFFGVALCATLIGIPEGIAYFKAIKYIVMPYGADIDSPNEFLYSVYSA